MSTSDLQQIFAYKTMAVVGCSPKPERPSHYVSAYLQQAGYKVIPVNPGFGEILGEKCYPSLAQIPRPVDVVVVFRKSEEVLPIAEEAIQIKAKVLWMQDGVFHPGAASLAIQAGLIVVMDDCIMRQLQNFR